MAEEQAPDEHRQGPIPPATWVVLGLAVILVAGLIGVRMEHQPDTSRDYPSRPLIPDGANVLLLAPEIDDEYLPCGDCHEPNDPRTNVTVRDLEEDHDEMEFTHGNLWCLNCHDKENRNSLRLSDGSLVAFEDSWQICTQCHAKKLPDWRAGVHGKRTGHWRGPKEYRTCVVCHDPHDPPFKPIAPEPAPTRPEEIRQTALVQEAPKTGGEDDEDS
jgi:formate-dependent nitrite reductase cytochrome c552 subunit